MKKVVDPCSKCPLQPHKAKTETPSELNLASRIVFIGEAPGKVEARLKSPFLGPAGAILGHSLHDLGLNRGDYSLINAVRCVNLDKPTPPMKAIRQCQKFFRQDMNQILEKHKDPIIICLGMKGWSALIGKQQQGLEDARGKTLTYFEE